MRLYIAVGRLMLAPKTGRFRFAWYALRTAWQARRAAGAVHASLRREDANTFWSLSVWDSEASMRAYRNSGAHRRAMQLARELTAHVEFAHWIGDAVPAWPEAMARLKQHVAQRRTGHG